jgi:hypothetical protein
MKIFDSVLNQSILSYHKINKENPEGCYRVGQSLFNTLFELDPLLANDIRGTHLDPFQSNSWSDKRTIDFMLWLQDK